MKAMSRVLALCGGVGGAKLAHGLQACIGEALTVVVNTGDDFEPFGLHVSPDIDTVVYTLAGLADAVRGWGRADESWNFMQAMAAIGGETWFALGDRDLAMHVERTRRLRSGESLAAITADLARKLGVQSRVVPMSDDAVRTMVGTRAGDLPFQHYFVRERCEPAITGVRFEGCERARPSAGFIEALDDPALCAIVFCPSNPYLSIDPMLAVPGVRQRLERRRVPAVAVSPVIGGAAVKGPTAKIMRELGVEVTSRSIADHYVGLIDGLVIDEADAADAASLPLAATVTGTLMRSDDDRRRLAAFAVDFASQLSRRAKVA